MKRKLLSTLIAGLAMAVGGAAQADISNGVVKIGVLADMSGPYGDVSGEGSTIATKMAAEDYIKQTGSKLKIEVISADHQNKPDVGSSIARKWYDSEGVDMIMDVTTSSVALAVSEVTKDKNKVLIDTGAGSPSLTGDKCSPNTIHYLYDTWELAHGTGSAVVKSGGDTWFFLTADYKFGHDLRDDTAAVVKENGGEILGAVNIPLGTQDYSSFLLQAQASKAKVIGLANAGADTSNSIKQASEFGIVQGGQKMAGLLVFINDIHALGLEAAQGLQITVPWYWDMTEENRAWAKEYQKARGSNVHPNANHAGIYSATLHYLKAVDALQEDADGVKVVEKMKSMPTSDPLFGDGGVIRVDGRKVHPVYLMEAKKPDESKYAWDYLKLVETIPADRAFRPLNEGGCYLVDEAKS